MKSDRRGRDVDHLSNFVICFEVMISLIQVRGRGASNPYRLRPFVGARVPLNGTFVSAVQLHNPHASTLRITEMYTSGGDLHLELPDVAPDTTHHSSLWVSFCEVG